RSGEGRFRAGRSDRKGEGAVESGISAFAPRPDSFHLLAFGGEQTADGSFAEIRRNRSCLRDHSGGKPVAITRADERDRGTHVGGDGREFSREIQRRKRRAARRRTRG